MEHTFGRLVYLASPYTHPDKVVEAQRYNAVLSAWRFLLENRSDYHYFGTEYHFFVPIVQSHQLSIMESGLPGDWQFWATYDTTMISRSDEFWVLTLPGFKESVGVSAERQIAANLGLPIRFLVPQGDHYRLTSAEP
jgi:hypothetical protein